MKHRYAEMITTKVNDMTLVKLCLTRGKWLAINSLQNIVFNPDLEYFLCHPKHADACLHWLNGGDVLISGIDANPYKAEIGWFKDCAFMLEDVCIQIKPDTIMIGNIKIPEPVYEPLEDGETYYVPNLVRDYAVDIWSNASDNSKRILAMGMVHSTKEAAIAHTEALRSFTEVSK